MVQLSLLMLAKSPTGPIANNLLLNNTCDLEVLFGGYSCAGIKKENQDAFAAYNPSSGSFPDSLVSKGVVAVLADGLSCANKAAEASQLAVTQFVTDYYATPDSWSTRKSAAKVLTSLNQWLYSQNNLLDSCHYINEQKQQWLTTFSALVLKSTSATVFHVGDTRISQFRQGQFETITKDHSCQQGGNSGVLTRALGADNRLQVDVHNINLQRGDVYLLTCDGIHDFLSTKQLTCLLETLPSEPSQHQLEKLSHHIVQSALDAGSDDNVSCLLVSVKTIASKKLTDIDFSLQDKELFSTLKPGQLVDNYEIIKVLSTKLNVRLYLATRPDLSQAVVLKVPASPLTQHNSYRQEFTREAWLGERVTHKNIMAIKMCIAHNTNSRFAYHVCEYIQGQTLSEWMFDNPRPSIGKVRHIITQVISALRAFQRLDIVLIHLNPDNIMINQYGQVKLINYGTAFIASIDEQVAFITSSLSQDSINYIAPETLLTQQADHQSDLFSLAVICYQMLTKNLPFKPKSGEDLAKIQAATWDYRSPKLYRDDIPLWLDLCLAKACHRAPKQRYIAFSEFYTDLNKPNHALVDAYKNQSFLEKDPVKFWQSIALLILTCFIITLLV